MPLDQFDGVVLAMFAPVPSRAFGAAFSLFFISALLRSRASQPWLYSRSVTEEKGGGGLDSAEVRHQEHISERVKHAPQVGKNTTQRKSVRHQVGASGVRPTRSSGVCHLQAGWASPKVLSRLAYDHLSHEGQARTAKVPSQDSH